jgi:hypothetical protein
MHNDDGQIDVRIGITNVKTLAETPIQFCTLSEIIGHLCTRFDAVAMSAIKRGAAEPVLTAVVGPIDLREELLEKLHEAHEITPDCRDEFFG